MYKSRTRRRLPNPAFHSIVTSAIGANYIGRATFIPWLISREVVDSTAIVLRARPSPHAALAPKLSYASLVRLRQRHRSHGSRFALPKLSQQKPVRLIVGFPPGGGTDVAARLISQWLSGRLGQTVIVENRPGAGNAIATEVAARADADGYALLLVVRPCHQRSPVRPSHLRPSRHRARRWIIRVPNISGGQSFSTGQEPRRIHRVSKKHIPAASIWLPAEQRYIAASIRQGCSEWK